MKNIISFLFSNRFWIAKQIFVLLVLILLGLYSFEKRPYFEPTLEDCYSNESLIQKGTKVVFSGTVFFRNENYFVQTKLGEFRVKFIENSIPPMGVTISLITKCDRSGFLGIFKWESRGNKKYIKYGVSIIGLVLSFLIFFGNFKLQRKGFTNY